MNLTLEGLPRSQEAILVNSNKSAAFMPLAMRAVMVRALTQ